MENKKLVEYAKEASKNAHAPYSKKYVGAALLTKEGRVYTGCNIENHGIQSVCAERVAFVKAISQGEKKFAQIAVVLIEEEKARKIVPCGYCRQFLSEFCDENFEVITYDEKEQKMYTYKLNELLPNGYKIN